ncbi:MAG TPA: DUF1080 domain-containing protein [Tepidisphaeraceae bacterium]|nr:DUF1080 domain-containing protein [Tepidisphaeraceae bacterium]
MNKSAIAIVCACLALTMAFAADAPPSNLNSLGDAEKQAGWKLLFDGHSTEGWRGLGMDRFPNNFWEIKDGCLHCAGGAKGNDIITADKYDNFDLTFEWMIPKLSGNSGVKYRVQETKGNGAAFGCEFQCMYDPGVEGKDATGSLYDVFPPKGKKLVPRGEFNQSRILVQGNHVEHWLNGVKVVEYEFGSDAFNSAVAKSKFKNSKTWAKEPLGYIALQYHHDEVFFRNLKIRQMPAASK